MAYLYDMPRFTNKHTLEETKAHLQTIGAPDEKIPCIIHVAGTNGKGSVCTYLRCLLEECGATVGLFTSPHLEDIRERFVIRGKMVSKEAFLGAFLQVYESLDWETLKAGEGYHPTFFEYLFFMGMLLFADAGLSHVILETGLGGRLDATNAVSKKALCILTKIGLDHTEYLGDTIEKIAAEKAGIIQPNVPVVYLKGQAKAAQTPGTAACAGAECAFKEDDPSCAANVIEAAILRANCLKAEDAEACENTLSAFGYGVWDTDILALKFHNKKIAFLMRTLYDKTTPVILDTCATYQAKNAALALRALEVLEKQGRISLPVVSKAEADAFAFVVQKAFAKAYWPGRMEEVLPGIFLDGAHNADGMAAFLDAVRTRSAAGENALLFGVVSDKDFAQMIHLICASGLFDKILLTKLATARSLDLAQLAEQFKKEHCGGRVCLYENVQDAWPALLAHKDTCDGLYVAGSLYLVGEIKELIHDQL